MVTCSNCGGNFEETLAKCPYCGQIYELGAEREYMEELRQMKEDLSELPEQSEEIYQKEVKHTSVKVFLILAVVVAVVPVILLLGKAKSSLYDYNSTEELKAEMRWEQTYFPQLDAWYEAEDYAAILEFRNQLYFGEHKVNAYYRWKHSPLIDGYEKYQQCMEIGSKLETGEEISDFEAGDIIYSGMSLLYFKGEEIMPWEDWQQIEQWQEEIRGIYEEQLGFTEETIEELYELLKENDYYIDWDACFDYGKEMKQRGIKQ